MSALASSPWWNGATDLFVQLVQAADIAAGLDAWWTRNVKSPDEAADAVLDSAGELLALADLGRARAVLSWLTRHAALGRVCPLAHYRLGELDGDLVAAAQRASVATDRAAMAWPGGLDQESLLEKVCDQAPGDGLARSLLGMIRLHLRKLAEAISALEAATRLDPADALAWRNLGLARWTVDQPWSRCLADYQRAIALWPDYVPLLVECDCMLRQRSAPVGERRAMLYETLHPTLAGDEQIATRRADLALATGEFEAGLAEITDKTFHPGEGSFGTHRLYARLSVRLGERLAGKGSQGDWAAALKLWRQSMEFPANMMIGRPKRVHESRPRYLAAMALENLGDGPAARAELEALLPICLRSVPTECYFGILALRKLGRAEEAGQWQSALARQVEVRSQSLTAESKFWATVARAMLERATGQRQVSNALLASLAPQAGDDMDDFLVTRLY